MYSWNYEADKRFDMEKIPSLLEYVFNRKVYKTFKEKV